MLQFHGCLYTIYATPGSSQRNCRRIGRLEIGSWGAVSGVARALLPYAQSPIKHITWEFTT